MAKYTDADKERAKRHRPRRMTVYVDPEIRRLIEKDAENARRTISAQVQLIFEDYLKGAGKAESLTFSPS